MKANKNSKNIISIPRLMNQVREEDKKWMIKRTHFIHCKKDYLLIARLTNLLINPQESKKAWTLQKARK
jgi:hypothetical protein